MERLRLETRTMADRVVLELHGELDLAAAPALAERMARVEAEASGPLVIDLDGLSFIDSAGLRVLLAAHERARERGRELLVTPGSPPVQRMLAVAGITQHLPTVTSADAALAGEAANPGPA